MTQYPPPNEDEYVGPPGWLIIGSLAALILIPAIFALYTLMTNPDSSFNEMLKRNSELGGGPIWLVGTFIVMVPVVGLWVTYVWKRSQEKD
ncbi:MAG: hypothetical protein H6673_09430 [Anaerolineales bacterium]|nr:hypothetical protein [Anaerolineales bacterium]